MEAFRQFSRKGGYPVCHTSPIEDMALLRQQIVNEVVTKTIEFDPIRRRHGHGLSPQLIREVFRLVCRYAGQGVRIGTLAKEMSAAVGHAVPESHVAEAVEFLGDSLLIHSVPPLEMLRKKNHGMIKPCICDHFVRNGVLQETVPLDPEELAQASNAVSGMAGPLVESVIGYFLKGIPGLDLAWWPSRGDEPEIDFVVSIGTQRLPIEVKYQRQIRREDYGGLEAFCAKPHYAAPFGLIITQDMEGQLSPSVLAIPLSTFLLVR